ncbi:hypothetical protein HYT45_04080 [Candidatus Uhrbacteria bacterium]|nr:hypothetical protein [Candidatus Wildermuthbacteria bacterium]MBI2099552.1 hypothetical protein [Candidatus Uhrbacteria bacterium]
MKNYCVLAAFLCSCGYSTYQYDTPHSQSYGDYGGEASYAASSAQIAVPVSPANQWGCALPLQLEIRNPSREYDVVVHAHRLVDDGTTFETSVNVPRAGSRIICLPDIGAYSFETEYYLISHGVPQLMGCGIERAEYGFYTNYDGRHGFRVYPRPDRSC